MGMGSGAMPGAETPYGGPVGPVQNTMSPGSGGAIGATPSGVNVEFNPETGMPMAPAAMVLPQTVQPISGPAPTPLPQGAQNFQYNQVD